MSGSVKFERLRELEMSVALCDRVNAELQAQLDQRRFGAAASPAAAAGVAGVAAALDGGDAATATLLAVLAPFLEDDKSKRLLLQQPVEAVGNLVAQFGAATAAAKKEEGLLRKAIQELTVAVAARTRQHAALLERIEHMRETTGVATPAATGLAAGLHSRLPKPRGEAKGAAAAGEEPRTRAAGSAAPGGTATAAVGAGADDDPGNPPVNLEDAAADVHRRANANADGKAVLAALRSETSVAKMLLAKQQKTVAELREQVAQRKKRDDDACAGRNAVRCLERDTEERMAALREMLRRHDAVDAALDAVEAGRDASCAAIMDTDCAALESALADVVERRRLQGRVLKAQEFRLGALTSRLEAVRAAVERHGLTKEVDLRIAEAEAANAQAQRERLLLTEAAAAAEGGDSGSGGGGASVVAAATGTARGSEGPSPNTRGVGGGDAQEGDDAAADGDGFVVVPLTSTTVAFPISADSYYDIDTIVPATETVNSALYSLFVADRDKAERRLRTLDTLVQERTAAVNVLVAKLADLETDTAQAQERRGAAVAENEAALAVIRDAAVAQLNEQRAQYAATLAEDRKLAAKLLKAHLPTPAVLARQQQKHSRPASASTGPSFGRRKPPVPRVGLAAAVRRLGSTEAQPQSTRSGQ